MLCDKNFQVEMNSIAKSQSYIRDRILVVQHDAKSVKASRLPKATKLQEVSMKSACTWTRMLQEGHNFVKAKSSFPMCTPQPWALDVQSIKLCSVICHSH